MTYKKQARQFELRSDLIDAEICICNKQLFEHINDDIEMRTFKEDFTINLNTSELTDDQVQAYILPAEYYYGRLTDPRTYQVLTRDIIQRKCYPFVIDFPVFKGNFEVQPHNKYIGSRIKRHLSSTISDCSVIGSDVEIGEDSVV